MRLKEYPPHHTSTASQQRDITAHGIMPASFICVFNMIIYEKMLIKKINEP